MYLGIDVGGTKTLVAVLTNDGAIIEQARFATPKNYDHFLLELRHCLQHFNHQDFVAAGMGMAVTDFDRKHGRGKSFSNLPWRNVPVQHDVERIVKCPLVLENDAKMAALSEYMMLRHEFDKVLYMTVSTGIGYGIVTDGEIDTNVGDGGGRTILLEHRGSRMSWEDFAGGRAIVARYGKLAEDIHDEATWKAISKDLAKGLIELIAMIEPEVVVFGGSVGNYFDRFGKLLALELKTYHLPLMTMPVLRGAARPDQAVIFGCFDLAKKTYQHAHTP